jgi:hypothetical protein
VVLQESQPALAWITAATDGSQIPGYAAFAHYQAQLQQFSVDPGRAPGGILIRQTSDQCTDLRSNFWSSAARSGSPSPEEPKSRSMPADHRLRLHNYQDLGPSRPDAAQGSPEQSVQLTQPWARPFPLEHGDLLPQGEDLQRSVMPTAEENAPRGDESKDELEHQS